MKTKYLTLFLILILLMPFVAAMKGAGIKWGVASLYMDEGQRKCIDYGIYNPWDEDVSIALKVDGEIIQFADKIELEPKLVRAGTSSQDAIFQPLCFSAKRVSGCSVGEIRNFKGEIVASPVISQESSGSGSTTATSASAPLELAVKCTGAVGLTSTTTILIGILIIVILLVIVLILKFRKS